jgi:hypothetical protein
MPSYEPLQLVSARSRTLLLLSKLEQHDIWRKYAYC